MAMYPCLSLPPLSFPTVSGAVCSFDSQYAGLPLKSHSVAVVGTQSGSGTPSPSNPRALNGWSAITITANSVPTVISIGSTIYGGNYDAVSGVLTVTHSIYTLTGNENWFIAGSGTNIRAYVDNLIPNKKYSANGICSCFKGGSANYPNEFDLIQNYVRFNVYGIATTSAEFNTWITNHSPIDVVYELATPTTIQLPSCPIETLSGVNNVFADTGDTTLQYIKLG